jgi:hypothetical protein
MKGGKTVAEGLYEQLGVPFGIKNPPISQFLSLSLSWEGLIE